jgi:hypothetical protein
MEPAIAGPGWLLDDDTNLMIAWELASLDVGYASEFMDDLAARLANRLQLTKDGHKAYLGAVDDAFWR